ncbi:hypothetical protein BH09CHL1_BH09CHL1_08520 [soil metagenome]
MGVATLDQNETVALVDSTAPMSSVSRNGLGRMNVAPRSSFTGMNGTAHSKSPRTTFGSGLARMRLAPSAPKVASILVSGKAPAALPNRYGLARLKSK